MQNNIKAYLLPATIALFGLTASTAILEEKTGWRIGYPWSAACALVQILSAITPVLFSRNPSDPMRVFLLGLLGRVVLLPIFLVIPIVFEQVELIFFLISVASGYIILQLIEIRWLLKMTGDSQ